MTIRSVFTNSVTHMTVKVNGYPTDNDIMKLVLLTLNI